MDALDAFAYIATASLLVGIVWAVVKEGRESRLRKQGHNAVRPGECRQDLDSWVP